MLFQSRLAAFGASLIASSFLPRAAPPIVRRADRADSAYVALARQFPCVGAIGTLGDGTLIAPRWVVTAAHVARGAQRRMSPVTVRIGTRDYAVTAVFIHPDWTDLGAHDIALLQLAEPVGGVAPVRLFDRADEAGGIAILVGNGKTGTGASRTRIDDGVWRAATSRIDSTDAASIFLSFDAPPGGTELEGAPSGGDSGGPALLRVGSRLYVAGISSAGFDGIAGPSSYGAVDVYTRVSTHRTWADSVMNGLLSPTSSEPAAATTAAATTAAVPLPDTPAGRRASAFVAAMRAGSDSAILGFLNANFASSELAARPAIQRLPNFRRLADQLKTARVIHVRESTPSSITIEWTSVSGGTLVIQLVCEENAPHAILDWRRVD